MASIVVLNYLCPFDNEHNSYIQYQVQLQFTQTCIHTMYVIIFFYIISRTALSKSVLISSSLWHIIKVIIKMTYILFERK